MKKMICVAALVAALIPFAVAQDNSRLPQASLDREVDVRVPAIPGTPAVLGNPRHVTPTPPTYCKPCLFYAGDFDSTVSNANGLANEVDTIVSSGAAVYTPFRPSGTLSWKVSGLFTDNFASLATLDPATSPYEIRKGIPAAGGSGGKLVCHGNSASTNTDTGLNDFGYEVYATKVAVKNCTLKAGIKYWESVVPYCTGSECSSYRAFDANDEGAMNHKFGPLEPANNAFFNSVFFGAVFQQTAAQGQPGRFSAGVIGKK